MNGLGIQVMSGQTILGGRTGITRHVASPRSAGSNAFGDSCTRLVVEQVNASLHRRHAHGGRPHPRRPVSMPSFQVTPRQVNHPRPSPRLNAHLVRRPPPTTSDSPPARLQWVRQSTVAPLPPANMSYCLCLCTDDTNIYVMLLYSHFLPSSPSTACLPFRGSFTARTSWEVCPKVVGHCMNGMLLKCMGALSCRQAEGRKVCSTRLSQVKGQWAVCGGNLGMLGG